MKTAKKIGLALGGGGAKGIAHIAVLEAFDEMGIKPAVISGASIGAVVGAVYASGMPASDLRERVLKIAGNGARSAIKNLLTPQAKSVLDFVRPDYSGKGLIAPKNLLARLNDIIGVENIEDLEIPLKVVAADFWNREEVVFDTGPVITALQASIALPVIFKPVMHNGRVLIDGGTVNPLPHDRLTKDCDLVVAVDVIGSKSPDGDLMPSMAELVFNTFQIMEKSLARMQAEACPPDILLEFQGEGIRALDFHRAADVLEQAESLKDQLKSSLGRLLEA